MNSTASLRIRPHLGEDIAIGPGKIDLLEAIQRRGSISGTARELGMSYRRAWLLVETMNRSFREPLVISLVGGRHGSGARLSNTWEQVLRGTFLGRGTRCHRRRPAICPGRGSPAVHG